MSEADESGEDSRTRLHRSIVIYSGLFLLIIAAVFSAVGILNRELYSAPAFVRLYLDAVARHDVEGALATPGVLPERDEKDAADSADTVSTALLTPDALSSLTDVELVSDAEIAPGRHRLVFSYTLSGLDDHEFDGQTEFDVVQTGTSWLLFPQWEFVRSPTATATVTVSHASDFTAGRAVVTTADPEAFHVSGRYRVLVPSLTVLSHDSEFLGARSVALAATKPVSAVSSIVDVQPTTLFLGKVQDAVNAFLDECAGETLLYPPGCPFGLDVNDRIASEPSWSIEEYPLLTILAGQESWVVPNAGGSARVVVDIRSLFDGTVAARDEVVPFDVTFALTIEPDNSIVFEPRA